jgi:hypothetical protein
MVAIAKTQTQQVTDLIALTAARTLNGNPSISYNQTAATTNAQNLLSYNTVLGQTISASNLTLTFGSYSYSQTTQAFSATFPPISGQPVTAVSASLTSSGSPAAFSRIWGQSLLPSVTAAAQAAHRPRDLALVEQPRLARTELQPLLVDQCRPDRRDRQSDVEL